MNRKVLSVNRIRETVGGGVAPSIPKYRGIIMASRHQIKSTFESTKKFSSVRQFIAWVADRVEHDIWTALASSHYSRVVVEMHPLVVGQPED